MQLLSSTPVETIESTVVWNCRQYDGRGQRDMSLHPLDEHAESSLNHSHFIGIGKVEHFLHSISEGSSVIPVHTPSDITDVPFAHMSDPFLVHEHEKTWFLFTKVVSEHYQKSAIAVSVSHDDLISFTYQQVVLSEPWEVGWPHVIKHGSRHFMITSAIAILNGPPNLWLYESSESDWPFMWEKKYLLLDGLTMSVGQAIRPTLFFLPSDQTWYLMVFDDGIGFERLFFSYRINSGYLEHPESQKYAWRRAGRVFMDHDNSPWVFVHARGANAADCTVVGLEIKKLSRTEFEYSPTPQKVYTYTGNSIKCSKGFNSFGAHRIGEKEWVLVVDILTSQSASTWSCPGVETRNETRSSWELLWSDAQKHHVLNNSILSAAVPLIAKQSLLSVCVGDCAVISAAKRIFSKTKDWVIVIIFNDAYLPMTKSWLCNTQFMDSVWEKALLISTDLTSVDILV